MVGVALSARLRARSSSRFKPAPTTRMDDTMPVRVQRKRAKDWRMPPNAVYVGRGTKWGNPFVVGRHGTAQECVELFALCLYGYLCISTDDDTYQAQKRLREAVRDDICALEGKDLACWCRAGKPCHADVLLQVANWKPPLPAPADALLKARKERTEQVQAATRKLLEVRNKRA